jgi:heme exporter protein B
MKQRSSSALAALLLRESRIARRIGGAASLGVVFFLCLVAITPFAIGPDLKLLAKIAPAILWIAALLATLLGLDRLFQADHDDGSLDLFFLGETPLELIVLVKCLAHWLATGLPLVAASPFFGLMLGLAPQALGTVALSLLVGTPGLTLIGAIGAGLTVSLRRGGLLLSILVLPLSVPILIFGVAAASVEPGGTVPFMTPFLILCGLTLVAVALTPFAAAAALRHSAE